MRELDDVLTRLNMVLGSLEAEPGETVDSLAVDALSVWLFTEAAFLGQPDPALVEDLEHLAESLFMLDGKRLIRLAKGIAKLGYKLGRDDQAVESLIEELFDNGPDTT